MGVRPELFEGYALGSLRAGRRHSAENPSCYTPDGKFLVGPVPGLDNLNLHSGCDGAGIAVSGGLTDIAADCECGAGERSSPYLPARIPVFDADSPEFPAKFIAVRSGKTDGRIWARSAPGNGATFLFTLSEKKRIPWRSGDVRRACR